MDGLSFNSASFLSLAAGSCSIISPLKIHTFTPSPFLPRTLPLLHIVDPYQWKTLGPIGFSQIPIGTGPFQPITYSSNKIILKAFRNSWRKPNIENIEIIAVPDAYTRTLGLVSDQLDIALSIGPDEITFIENSGGKGVAWLSADLWSINFHHKKGTPMDHIEVREALNLAINRKELIDGLLNGVPEIPSQPPPRNPPPELLDEYDWPPVPAKASSALVRNGLTSVPESKMPLQSWSVIPQHSPAAS